MLSGGFRFLADVLPNNAGVSLVHGIEYYGGNGIGHPIFVLALYAAAAVAVCFAQAYRRSHATAGNVVATSDLAYAAQ
jgi:hypothetical protein